VLSMDFSISSKRNMIAFQARFFEMLSVWNASFFLDMTRISRGMNQRDCKDRAVWLITQFQPRTGFVDEILDRPGFAEPFRDQIVDGSPVTRPQSRARKHGHSFQFRQAD
jgi:hypothetical protein